jgi:hypothetical protein
LRLATPQNETSGFHSSGIWPYNPNVFSVADYVPPSITDFSYPDFTPASPADLPDPEILHSCADKVSLSKTESPLSNNLLTQCEQLKPGSFTGCSLHDVRPCPTDEQSVQSGRKRKCQRAEILTSTPVKKLQRENFDKKRKERVRLPESKKGASLKFVLPRKQRVFLPRGIFARCVKIPALNRPKRLDTMLPVFTVVSRVVYQLQWPWVLLLWGMFWLNVSNWFVFILPGLEIRFSGVPRVKWLNTFFPCLLVYLSFRNVGMVQ